MSQWWFDTFKVFAIYNIFIVKVFEITKVFILLGNEFPIFSIFFYGNDAQVKTFEEYDDWCKWTCTLLDKSCPIGIAKTFKNSANN